ncbi:MAG: hypothetical protein Q9192_004298 [Flavoplaca navasiana]
MALETYCGAMEYLFDRIQLVLAKPYLLVEDLKRASAEENRAFAFLYCNYKERAQQTFKNLISSLTRQLIQHSRTIPSELRQLYQCSLDKQIRPSRQELLGLLTTVGSNFSSLCIVIDALDECDNDEEIRSSLVSTLCEALPRACFLVTSRLVPEIEDQFKNRPRLEIKATDEDIRRYVSDQILRKPTLKRHIKADPNLRELMIETIRFKSDGMFLMVTLHTASLATKPTRNALRCALESLPTELDDTYDEALQRIRDQKEELVSLAENVLMWVLFAVEPLEIVELQHAIASISLGGQTIIGDEDLTDPETLLDVCGGIVVVDEESDLVRLVHYTAQEYFDRRHPLRSLPVVQVRITKTCITYLSLVPFNCSDIYSLGIRLDWVRQYPFACYAALHWGKHARGVPEDDYHARILELISKKTIRAITADVSSHLVNFKSNETCLESLAYAAAFGLTSIVNNLLDEGVDVNQINYRGITALMSAAKAGYTDTVRVLLKADADVNKADKWGSTALEGAAGAGHIDTVRFLLAADAAVDQASYNNRTALMTAASKGHDEVVQILLDHGANIEAATVFGDTSLMITAEGCFTSTVELLVDKGANMNAGIGLLQAAIESGSMAMVELAANKIGEVTKADHTANPLFQLSKSNRPTAGVFKFLIEKGADPTSFVDGETPIHVAARNGNVEAIRSLLKHGVSPNIRDEHGNTPIHRAAFSEHLEANEMIEVLVDNGADLTAQNHAGESGLHTFLRSEHCGRFDHMLPLLVRRNIPLNTPDAKEKTALYLAAHRDFEYTVAFLMKQGADGSRREHGGRTPLETAAVSGNEELVEQMLKHRATRCPPHLPRLLAGTRLRNAVKETILCLSKKSSRIQI